MKCPECDSEIKDGKDSFWDNMGCLPASLGIVIIIWAVSGFPGLS